MYIADHSLYFFKQADCPLLTSNERNTIHIDDLVRTPLPPPDGGFIKSIQKGRNFALNPNEGLKISAFKHAHTERAAQDRELDKLALYLVHIAGIDDFRSLNHRVGSHLWHCRLWQLTSCRTGRRCYYNIDSVVRRLRTASAPSPSFPIDSSRNEILNRAFHSRTLCLLMGGT